MNRKKILVLTPYTPTPSFIKDVINPLAFLEPQYDIDSIDSLAITDEVSNDVFYQLWKQKLMHYLPHYDAFLGFSFGGVILQQCLSIFADLNKPIVLFSTPTFADDSLTRKLGKAISLCQQNRVDEALVSLYQHVHYPYQMPEHTYDLIDHELASKRLIYSFERLLKTDSRLAMHTEGVNLLHLIGECSDLVNSYNVVAPPKGRLITVPDAGMRILGDNPIFCKRIIMEGL